MTFRKWFYNHVYLRTPYWKAIRKEVGARAGWFCQARKCGLSGYGLEVHHTTYRILWFEWLFPDKLVYLCRKHHQMTHDGHVLVLHGGKILKPFGR